MVFRFFRVKEFREHQAILDIKRVSISIIRFEFAVSRFVKLDKLDDGIYLNVFSFRRYIRYSRIVLGALLKYPSGVT